MTTVLEGWLSPEEAADLERRLAEARAAFEGVIAAYSDMKEGSPERICDNMARVAKRWLAAQQQAGETNDQ